MDSFYSSIEMRTNPKLRDVPLAIGKNPRYSSGSGIVSTANYVARMYGIKSAMPTSGL